MTNDPGAGVPRPAVISVAFIDDDEWVRRGRAAALDQLEGFTVVGAWSPSDALARTDPGAWDAIDVVVLDAHDSDAGFDQFIGVKVAQHVRSLTGRDRPRIVVITGHTLNDLLRVRMAQAGADFLYGHFDVRTVDDLRAVITAASTGHVAASADTAPTAGALAPDAVVAGDDGPDLNATVAWAEQHLGEPALQPESQKALPVSRRSIINARQRVGRHFTDPGDAGRHGPRDGTPTWKDVARFLDRARGKERRERS